MAPGVTFWDAGEFIAAAHGLGVPHPPGTPLFVSLGRSAIVLLGGVLGAARAMNLVSALASAGAGALGAWMLARASSRMAGACWGALAGALCAGLMTTVWSNATEAEVYALALLHASALLAAGWRAGACEEEDAAGERWLLLVAYLLVLAPAVHLSVLVAAPATIALAARSEGEMGRVHPMRALLLAGCTVAAAGVGRMSPALVMAGAAMAGVAVVRRRGRGGAVFPLAALAASALLIMLVRARFDPPVNQGNPATWRALADVVSRKQYAVQGVWPRQAPPWLQLANVVQYADWQGAMGWGRGVFTSVPRVVATVALVLLGMVGARALRRDSRRLGDALLVLLASGTLGVAVYLNLKAGASLGWGVLPDSLPHEARERDYFFVLGFWSWGLLAGYGALEVARRRRLAPWIALAPVVLLLAGNGRTANRAGEPGASAPRLLARALLESAPRGAVLFVEGDNDSYPLWYLQRVEGVRLDVTTVTLPLLPAPWYPAEIARRTGLRWSEGEPVPGARFQHEEIAGRIARAARRAGRPVAASPAVEARERALLGSRWRLEGVDYVAMAPPADGAVQAISIDGASARVWSARVPRLAGRTSAPDDRTESMLGYLACPRLAQLAPGRSAARDSLEVKCNVR